MCVVRMVWWCVWYGRCGGVCGTEGVVMCVVGKSGSIEWYGSVDVMLGTVAVVTSL